VAKEGKRFLVHIELAGADIRRLQALVPPLHEAFQRMSNGNYQQAYHSPARDTLGYLLRTALAAAQVRARLKESGPSGGHGRFPKPPILASHDKVLVLEIGEEFDAREFKDKLEPWLRHH
jgi:hypothetical protein